jgi:hypothetical protein
MTTATIQSVCLRLLIVVTIILQSAAVAAAYVPLGSLDLLQDLHNDSELFKFSNAAVFKDAGKLHVLPFSILAVVESRYDILRVSGLFHEFSQKFPKKPYVAIIAVELPRKNHSAAGVDGNGEASETSASAKVPVEGSLRLKNFLTALRFKEHMSIDLSYLQYEGILSAEIGHHLFHYMTRMTAMPEMVVTVGSSVTAVSAGAIAALFHIPVVQLSTARTVNPIRYVSNSVEVNTRRSQEALANSQSHLVFAITTPSTTSTTTAEKTRSAAFYPGLDDIDTRLKTQVVGSLLLDTITSGLNLNTKQLTQFSAMLAYGRVGKDGFEDGSGAQAQSQEPKQYLIVGCSFSCSNMIDRQSHRVFVQSIKDLASVHYDKIIYVLLDEERTEYTFYNANHSLFGTAPSARLDNARAQFRYTPNVAVLDTIVDYAIYVNFVLSADLYVADCDMSEGFVDEEVISLDVRVLLLSLPASAPFHCPVVRQSQNVKSISIYNTDTRGGHEGRGGREEAQKTKFEDSDQDPLLRAVRDLLRTPRADPNQVSQNAIGDGLASKRTACRIARYVI